MLMSWCGGGPLMVRKWQSPQGATSRSKCGLAPTRRARSAVCQFTGDRPANKSQTSGKVAPVRKEQRDSNGGADDHDLVDWRNAWYAVHPIVDLPKDRPHAITILGKELVIWLDGDKQWRVFEDSCPHRKVALSEGRIEDDGTLSCAYHGWRFNGSGACTRIPQLPDEHDRAARVTSSAHACATAFPTQEADGLLWVWMDSRPDAFQLAASAPLPTSGGDVAAGPWYFRDLPISWEVVIENINDPSHVPFAHHGIQGNRNKPTQPSFDFIEKLGKKGYIASESNPRQGPIFQRSRNRLDHSHLPSRYDVCIDIFAPSEQSKVAVSAEATPDVLTLRNHLIPVTRTSSRLIFRAEYAGANEKSRDAIAKRPAWHDHLERNDILNGDGIFLHKQDTLMQQGLVNPREYFTPAAADKAVLAFWDFMKKHAPNGINYYPHHSEPIVLPREVVLDRYNQHTKHCSSCSRALKLTRLARQAAVGVITACLCVAVVLTARGGGPISLPMGAAVLLTAFAVAAIKALTNFEAKFVFADYIHADK